MPKMTLEALRVNKGLTQEEASKLLKISKYTLANYENGKSFPSVPVIQRITELYETDYNHIDFLCK